MTDDQDSFGKPAPSDVSAPPEFEPVVDATLRSLTVWHAEIAPADHKTVQARAQGTGPPEGIEEVQGPRSAIHQEAEA